MSQSPEGEFAQLKETATLIAPFRAYPTKGPLPKGRSIFGCFFLLVAAWIRSQAERSSVSYTMVIGKIK